MNPATLRMSALALLLALAACGGGGDDAPPPAAAPPPAGLQPTLASIQTLIFTPSCAKAGCHNAASAQAGLVLDPGASWANLVNVASSQPPAPIRVIPMNPDGSFLIRKLEGTQTVGGRMPADGPPYLQQATVDVIRQWILDGALP